MVTKCNYIKECKSILGIRKRYIKYEIHFKSLVSKLGAL